MKAFITGLTGQDGRYLSELLLNKGYRVHGLTRRTAQSKVIPSGVIVHEGDVTDPTIKDLIQDIQPDEVYHLAAMSHVGESFKIPKTTFEINAIGTLNVLEGAKSTGSRFYQASTSELFGSTPPPQNEKSPFHPRSPYGISKLAAYWLTVNYREAYGLYACNGILFNHESPIRGVDFVTRKVCQAVARIKFGLQRYIFLGNLDARRDWGHAKDFVEAMWLVMQQPGPDDYIVATGESRSVRELLTEAFRYIGIEDWSGFVKQDKDYIRPADVGSLIGDSSRIGALGWKPEYSFESLIKEMMESEIAKACKEASIGD